MFWVIYPPQFIATAHRGVAVGRRDDGFHGALVHDLR